jgi:hypothetical protein
MLITILTSSSLVVLFSTYFLKDSIGFYIAFIQNLLMSILFILMLNSREDLRGQSIYIGLFKMIGTAFASSAFYLYDPIDKGSILTAILYITIFFFDIIYVIKLYKKKKLQNMFGKENNPYTLIK